ncbi:TIGR02611 family protein [Micromonospora sp. WMMD812]|uniref:TIGR02611 family protein n=1 Tax=Micromonospora sp. WMMD812 TaxID=3015152 RepID=UPI00248C5D3C|nr:TIGR02611 family protein [Micromonospora sp. WMMD812]WBB70131.1 TIGR02611 family protein [Micromonospora sp. WMMD812]
MVTKRSSVDPIVAASSPNVAVRAAEKRGYAVPMDQDDRPGGRASGDGPPEPGPGGIALAERRRWARWQQRVSTTLDLIRANPTGRIALKIFISIAGALVVTLGIALIPLPGPGWLLVIAGLGIWAVEYHWARRLLGFTRRHVHNWTQWVKDQSLGVRFVLGAVGLVFVAVVVWLSLKYSLGIDLVARVMHYLATH